MVMGITAGELVLKDYATKRRIMGPWLREQSLAMIYAPRGLGKTWFVLSLAYAAANGSPFLTWMSDISSLRVAYFDGEMGESALSERVKLLVDCDTGEGIDEDAIRFVTFEHCGGVIWNLADARDQKKYTQAADGCGLIVIDNISTCVRECGRESEVEAWARVQAWAIAQRSAGKTILFVHHAGKSGEQRGTSRREDCMDVVVGLKRPQPYSPSMGSVFELHFEKNRDFYGDDAEPLFVSLKHYYPDRLVFESERLSVKRTVDVNALDAKGFKPTDIADLLGLSLAQTKQILAEGHGGKTEAATRREEEDEGRSCYLPNAQEEELF